MEANIERAMGAAERLDAMSATQLFEVLGTRLKKIGNDASGSDNFDMVVPKAEAQGWSDVLDFGKKFFARVERQAFDVFCGRDSENQKLREQVAEAFGTTSSQLASTLATVLVAQLALAPAIAAVVAALILKLVAKPALATTCDAWRGRVHPGQKLVELDDKEPEDEKEAPGGGTPPAPPPQS